MRSGKARNKRIIISKTGLEPQTHNPHGWMLASITHFTYIAHALSLHR